MTEQQIQTYMRRIARIESLGLPGPQAEGVADRLHWRDMDGDDRRMCVECVHFRSRIDIDTDERQQYCSRKQAALPVQLQRCPAFTEAAI